MRCKKVREIIFAESYDSLAGSPNGDEFAKHLSNCPQCRQLKEETKRISNNSFTQALWLKAPEGLWLKIKKEITSPVREKRTFMEILGQLRHNLIVNPKPALAFAAITASIAIIFTFQEPNSIKDDINDYLEDQLGFYASLDNGDSLSTESSFDFGTAIEYFFL
jgi:hypothetical protein